MSADDVRTLVVDRLNFLVDRGLAEELATLLANPEFKGGNLLIASQEWAVTGTDSSGDDWIDSGNIHDPYTREDAERHLNRHYREDGHLSVRYLTEWTEAPR